MPNKTPSTIFSRPYLAQATAILTRTGLLQRVTPAKGQPLRPRWPNHRANATNWPPPIGLIIATPTVHWRSTKIPTAKVTRRLLVPEKTSQIEYFFRRQCFQPICESPTVGYSSGSGLCCISAPSPDGARTIADNFHDTWVARCTHRASPICRRMDSLVAWSPSRHLACNISATMLASCSACGISIQPHRSVMLGGNFGLPTTNAAMLVLSDITDLRCNLKKKFTRVCFLTLFLIRDVQGAWGASAETCLVTVFYFGDPFFLLSHLESELSHLLVQKTNLWRVTKKVVRGTNGLLSSNWSKITFTFRIRIVAGCDGVTNW